MITLQQLKDMKPNIIFAKGQGKILHPWFNEAKNVDENNETPVKWVAIRGGIHDWAIYHSMDANITMADYFDDPSHLQAPNETIARAGAKLHNEERIKEFVPCDDESFKMYRH